MKASEMLAALNDLSLQAFKDHGSADYDTAQVMRHLSAAADSIQREKGSAIEGSFETQGGGGNPL